MKRNEVLETIQINFRMCPSYDVFHTLWFFANVPLSAYGNISFVVAKM